MSDSVHLCRFVVFLTVPVHLTVNSPQSLMRFTGEKRILIAHQFSNLVPEIATIVESCLIAVNFHLLDGNAQWCLITTFHPISTIIVSTAISVL